MCQCDTCGAPAVLVVADVVDETIIEDKWVRYAPIGIYRAGCADHSVASRVYKPKEVPLNAPWRVAKGYACII